MALATRVRRALAVSPQLDGIIALANSVSTIRARLQPLLARAIKSPPWSMFDQALQSGSNLVIMVLLARELGVAAFGAFVIAQTYLQYANLAQLSLVITPMLSAAPSERDAEERHALVRGFSAYNCILVAPSIICIELAAFAIGHYFPNLSITGLALPLAGATMAYQFQDWSRRALYASSRSRDVFIVDVVAYGGYLVAVISLALLQHISAITALLSQTVAFGASALLAITLYHLTPDWKLLPTVVRRYWKMGRDVLVSAQLQWIGSWGVMLAGSGMIGPSAAGATRAVQSLLGPLNVLLQWMENVIPVRCAQRYRDGGEDALNQYLRRATWAGIVVFGSITLAVTIIREPLMAFALKPEYRPFAWLLTVQGAYFLLAHLFRMQTYALRTMGSTGALQPAGLVWAIVGFATLPISVHFFDAVGVLFAVLAGEAGALIFLLAHKHFTLRASRRA